MIQPKSISAIPHPRHTPGSDDPGRHAELEPSTAYLAKSGRANSNPDGEEEDADDDKLEERRRKWNGKAEYVTIKNWVTGECATMEDSDIMNELHDLAR